MEIESKKWMKEKEKAGYRWLEIRALESSRALRWIEEGITERGKSSTLVLKDTNYGSV